MNIAELINNTLKEAQELMTSKTVVGEPIRTDTHTVIPCLLYTSPSPRDS